MGPTMDYLASCNGDCTTYDATEADCVKMAHFGLDTKQTVSDELRGFMTRKGETYHPTSGPGLWGIASMIQDGSKRTLQIPASLKAGSYIWRTELWAVHANPAQGCTLSRLAKVSLA